MVKKKKETYLSTFFIDLEGRVSFAYVPVRDQNLEVRGKNSVWFVVCFLLVLKKVLKWKKAKAANEYLFVFFMLKKNDLKCV